MFFYESEILSCLEFNTSRILTIDFLNYFAEDAGFNSKNKRYFYSLYLLNISYLSLKLRSIPQSLLAFSIVYFVNRIFAKDQEWPPTRADPSNLLRPTKKIAFLKVGERFEEWSQVVHAFHKKFSSALDEIVRIGEAPNKLNRNLVQDNRFLSKISNSLKSDSRRNNLTDRSLADKENKVNLDSIENSKNRNMGKDPQSKSVFTQKNKKRCPEGDKSTGNSRVQSQMNVPRNKISSFRIMLGKSPMTGKDQDSGQDNPDFCPQKVSIFKEIEFDFSRVKSVAMDVFNGTFIFFIFIFCF